MQYCIITHMQRARKITVEIPPELLGKAQQTYAKLQGLRGKVRFSRTPAELKVDR